MDRAKIEKGMFLTSGPPADLTLTKVFVTQSVEETDEKFDEAARLHDLLDKTKRAIAALKGKPQ